MAIRLDSISDTAPSQPVRLDDISEAPKPEREIPQIGAWKPSLAERIRMRLQRPANLAGEQQTTPAKRAGQLAAHYASGAASGVTAGLSDVAIKKATGKSVDELVGLEPTPREVSGRKIPEVAGALVGLGKISKGVSAVTKLVPARQFLQTTLSAAGTLAAYNAAEQTARKLDTGADYSGKELFESAAWGTLFGLGSATVEAGVSKWGAAKLAREYVKAYPDLSAMPRKDLINIARAAQDSYKVANKSMTLKQWEKLHSDRLYQASESLKAAGVAAPASTGVAPGVGASITRPAAAAATEGAITRPVPPAPTATPPSAVSPPVPAPITPAAEPPAVTVDAAADALQKQYSPYKRGEQMAFDFTRRVKKIKAPTTAQVLTAYLDTKAKDTRLPVSKLGQPTPRRVAGVVEDTASRALMSVDRMDRVFDALDGYDRGGPLRTAIWDPVRTAANNRREAINVRHAEIRDELEGIGVNPAEWMSHPEAIGPGRHKFTKAQQIGTAMLSMNPNGRRYLSRGMGMTASTVRAARAAVAADPKMTEVMTHIQRGLQVQWERLYDAAIKAGIPEETLQQEKNYFPLMLLDPSSVGHRQDYLDMLIDRFMGKPTPNKGILQKRSKGAYGEVEIDAFVAYLNNIARAESFIAMAETAKKVGGVTGSPHFRQAFNKATNSKGTAMLDKWLEHTVRGQAGDPVRGWEKAVRTFRVNAKHYILFYKVLSGLRQITSLPHGLSADPKVAAEWARLAIGVHRDGWRRYSALKEEAEAKSLTVKNRSWDRDIRRKYDTAAAKQFLRNARVSPNGAWLMNKIDKYTVVMVWQANYQYARQSMPEAEAVKFADEWVGKTQPMADPEYLPDMWRQGELAKVITDFQQMPNQTWNILKHEVLGQRLAGKINNRTALYRVLMTTVLPAIVLGAIGRGRPQKSLEELFEDLATYGLLTNIPVAGPWLAKALAGFRVGSGLAGYSLDELKKAAAAFKRGDTKRVAISATKAVGAATGKIPQQAVSTAEGALDLAEGKTDDPRRLVWSKYQLEGSSNKRKKTGADWSAD